MATDAYRNGRAFAGEGFLAATHRLGITDYLTGELRAELESDRQTLGLGAAVRMSSFGTLSAALASSRSPAGAGGLVSVGLERQANRLTFGIHTQLADSHFAQLGLDPHQPSPRRLTNVNIRIATPASGGIGLAYVFLDDREHPVDQLVSVSYNLQLRQFGFASVGVSRAVHQPQNTTAPEYDHDVLFEVDRTPMDTGAHTRSGGGAGAGGHLQCDAATTQLRQL